MAKLRKIKGEAWGQSSPGEAHEGAVSHRNTDTDGVCPLKTLTSRPLLPFSGHSMAQVAMQQGWLAVVQSRW